MKDIINKGYRNEEGIFVEKKVPSNRTRCLSSDGGEWCDGIALKGYWFCKKHSDLMNKIKVEGRKYKINPQVKEALLKNE